ncbi:MAG: ABC transporter ATP-binding protein [Opitutales bacterium]
MKNGDRPALDVTGLCKSFLGQPVLESVSFTLPAGETLAILGESGCGKTTLLRIVGGLLPAEGGRITAGDREISHGTPRERGIVYLGQETLLFEHLDCFENIAFALRLKRLKSAAVHSRVEPLLRATGLVAHARKRSHELSGGQKQRAAFARAILADPRVLLLDEPFGSLDAITRQQMQTLFRDLRAQYSMTSIFVTHDLKEALAVGDRFAVLRDGRMRTFATRADFLKDDATGVRAEVGFWKEIADEIETDRATDDLGRG